MRLMNNLHTSISGNYSNVEQFEGAFPVGRPVSNTEPTRTEPRTYKPHTGQNVILKPRSEFPHLIPFEVLDYVARNTDLIQISENLLLNQISARKWDIVPSDPEDKSNYTKEIEIVKNFFKYPDRERRTYYQWVRKLLKNITRYDALCLYKRRDKKGKLLNLDIIDGSLIKPLTDSNGFKIMPPDKTYQEIIYGSVRGAWSLDEMIYAPMSEDLVGHYGTGPVERIIVATLHYIKKQLFDYAYYDKGAYPDGGLFAVEPNDQSQWSPEDIMAFQSKWDDEMATAEKRQSLKFVPAGQLFKTKEYHWDTVQEEWFGRKVALTIGVDPYTFVKQVNRSVADTEDRKQTELGLKPYLKHLEDINTSIIQTDLGFEFLSFKTIDEKLEDQKAKVEKNKIYLMQGIYCRNEIRKEEGKEPIEGGDIYTVQVGNAIIPVEDVKKSITVPANGTDNGDNVGSMETETRNLEVTDNKKPQEKPKEKPEVKKALGAYKSFLIQRFKRNGNLYGFEHEDLSSEIIKTIENRLVDVRQIEDIHDIFKADSDEDTKENEKKSYWL